MLLMMKEKKMFDSGYFVKTINNLAESFMLTFLT